MLCSFTLFIGQLAGHRAVCGKTREYLPPEALEKTLPEPPKPPRKPSHRLSPAERQRYAGKPSWNGRNKRGWDGPDLPPRAEGGQTTGEAHEAHEAHEAQGQAHG